MSTLEIIIFVFVLIGLPLLTVVFVVIEWVSLKRFDRERREYFNKWNDRR